MINQNKLEGAIRSKGYTEGRLAKEMQISANTFSTKKKKGTFTLAQVDQICMILEINEMKDRCEIFLPTVFQ